MLLVYCICPKCDFDMVVERRTRAYYCPLCSGDNGRDVLMREYPVSTAPGKVEGRDARK
jgi:Zn finger protein HypA/HybF involved in hydrogenase expression